MQLRLSRSKVDIFPGANGDPLLVKRIDCLYCIDMPTQNSYQQSVCHIELFKVLLKIMIVSITR